MNKYKIILLWLIPIALWFWFSNATTINCVRDETNERTECTPTSFTVNWPIERTCSSSDCATVQLSCVKDDEEHIINLENWSTSCWDDCMWFPATCGVVWVDDLWQNYSWNITEIQNSWWSEWWNEWWIVSWWINAFSWIIDRLGSIFGEFWPYILYIAIACLWISLLFKALKSLLWFTDNKAKNSIWRRQGMKERRRRRRQQRRRTYTQEEKQYDYSHKYYYKNWWKGKRYRRSFKTSWAYSKK